MILNENTAISTPQALLVPYEPFHVDRYHQWMQDAALREATASDALSLAAERENQGSWRSAPDKLTFILCRPLAGGGVALRAGVDDAPARMVGDVNLFLRDGERGGVVAEVDVMVAERAWRRRGVGGAAVRAAVVYTVRHWAAVDRARPLEAVVAKVAVANGASAALFAGLGFLGPPDSRADYFGELTLRLEQPAEAAAGGRIAWWAEAQADCREVPYLR